MTTMTGMLVSRQLPAFTEVGTTKVAGQPAYVLRATDGSTLDASAAAPHYPLAASATGSPSGPGAVHQIVTYSQWNSVPAPTAPPAGQVVNAGGSAP
jgi:hypothetical protein